jgi:pyridoxine 4-dehydrogenase
MNKLILGASVFVLLVRRAVALAPTSPSRRDFLATAAVGAASIGGASLATTGSAAASASGLLRGQIDLPPIGLGAWSWGDSFFWGYDSKNDDALQQVFNYALSESKSRRTLIDTAEIYGFGRSEELIGKFSKDYVPPDQIQIATKFAPFPFRTSASDVVKACQASTQRLGRPIDLYQIHFPNVWSNAEYWDGLAAAYDLGLVKSVGVSNYGVDAVRACHAALAARGIQLATNQIQLSLLYRHPTENGLLQACEDLGVKIMSYSPLGLGMLAGKYTPAAPPQGPREKLYQQLMSTPDYERLLATMRDVASGHGATPAQVAINWARARNTTPIPGARTMEQIQQNYGALSWSLTKEEDTALTAAAKMVQTFTKPDAVPFPRKDIRTGLIMFDS